MRGMLICPHCRGQVAENPALAGQLVVCPHCINQFATPSIDQVPPAPLRPLVVGNVLTGVHFRGSRGPRPAKINPVVAGMLSLLFPGLGQFAQGRGVEGTCFLVAGLVVLAIGCLVPPAFFLGLIVLIWSIVDAASYSR